MFSEVLANLLIIFRICSFTSFILCSLAIVLMSKTTLQTPNNSAQNLSTLSKKNRTIHHSIGDGIKSIEVSKIFWK